MSAVYDKTWDLFMAASLSDDDLGYPDEVEFVPGDEEWADEVVWRNLTEGRRDRRSSATMPSCCCSRSHAA